MTGNAASRCRLDFVQEAVAPFARSPTRKSVAVVDATHYGLEKPPQLAMVPWFEELGLPAAFSPGRPERAS